MHNENGKLLGQGRGKKVQLIKDEKENFSRNGQGNANTTLEDEVWISNFSKNRFGFNFGPFSVNSVYAHQRQMIDDFQLFFLLDARKFLT